MPTVKTRNYLLESGAQRRASARLYLLRNRGVGTLRRGFVAQLRTDRKSFTRHRRKQQQSYQDKKAYLDEQLESVDPQTLFREIFPRGSFERAGHSEDSRPNGIYTQITGRLRCNSLTAGHYSAKKRSVGRNTIIFDDLEELDDVAGAGFAVTSCIAYSGRRRVRDMAYQLYGIIIDLDYVNVDNIRDLLYQMSWGILPLPTYLVNSGTGLHLYYILHAPIALYNWMYDGLNSLKHGLIDIVWNRYTSESKNKQYQPILQGYRIPGTLSKLGVGYLVEAYRLGRTVDLDYLNEFVDSDHKAVYKDRVSLYEAKELWPDWYERRIVRGLPPGQWICHRGLYDWWIMQIQGGWWRDKIIQRGTYDGNRYHCICVLFAIAIKCGIPGDEALADALSLVPGLNRLTVDPDNEFTTQDVMDAYGYYNSESARLSVDGIVRRTGIEIVRNRRHTGPQQYRRRKEDADREGRPCNLEARAWSVRDAGYPDGSWRNRMGRPKGKSRQRDIITAWRAEHPDGKKIQCHRDTGISRTTIDRWWDCREPIADPVADARSRAKDFFAANVRLKNRLGSYAQQLNEMFPDRSKKESMNS